MAASGETCKVAVFAHPGAELTIADKPIPEPKENEVQIRVHACGLCHGDAVARYGHMSPKTAYPLTPGHEVAGVISKVGPGPLAAAWKVGDRVAVGWYGGCCFTCTPCREGEPLMCTSHVAFTGIQRDGGYAPYMTARAEAVARIPDGLDFTQAGPLVCAGVTVFNAIRHNSTHLRAGHVVAVLGVGGLGHLAIQFAARMGYFTVAVSRGNAKKESSLALGAHAYIDSGSQDVAAELTKLGGAKLVIVTTTGGHETLGALTEGLAYHGTIVLAGVDDKQTPIPVSALGLIPGRKSFRGAASGHSRDSEETMEFAHRFGVRVKTEIFPSDKAPEAFAHMMSGE